MTVFNIVGIALTAAALAVLLKQYRQDFSMLVGLGAGTLILVMVILKLQPAVAEINSLLSKSGVNPQYVQILLKSLGICFVTQLASDSCRDAGETAVASKVELAGKVCILLLALPLFEQIANLAVGLMGK